MLLWLAEKRSEAGLSLVFNENIPTFLDNEGITFCWFFSGQRQTYFYALAKYQLAVL